MGHFRPGKGVSADFAGGAGSPPRRGLDGKPELTEAPRLCATAAEGIPEGFRQAKAGRVAPGGAEARSPSPARNESGRDRNRFEILKRQSLFGIAAFLGALLLPDGPFRAESQGSPGQEILQSGAKRIEILTHDLTVQLFPKQHRLVAVDRQTVKVLAPEVSGITFSLSSTLRVTAVEQGETGRSHPLAFRRDTDAQETTEPRASESGGQRVIVTLDPPAKAGKRLDLIVRYQGILNDPPRLSRHLRFVTPSQTTGHIGTEGVYLSGETRWYPDLEASLATYRVTVTLPKGWEAVTQGHERSRETSGDRVTTRWTVDVPSEALTLAANRFVKNQRDWNGIEIATYLFPEDAHLSGEYLDATARYLEVYTERLGPYPFPKFAVVENFFPSGLGMPSFTLLGSRVIKRRYTQPYALGHEIVHSWLGNSVLNDFAQGNWVEGLTTYLANYYYVELTGTPEEARDQRRLMLLGYAVYVRPEDDYALRSFRQKTDQKDNAIGYQKAAMVFHMLRGEIGDQAFWTGIRHLVARHSGAYASWGDLEKAFSLAAGRNLRWFFAQWVERPGAPHLRVMETALLPHSDRPGGTGYRITGRIRQEGEARPYRLRLPVLVSMVEGQSLWTELEVDQREQVFELTVPAKPTRLFIDPDHASFQRLPRQSLPAILNLYITDRTRALMLPTGGSEAERKPYQALARRIGSREQGRGIVQTRQLDASTKHASVLVLGGPDLNRAADWAVQGCGPDVRLAPDRFTIAGQTYEGPKMALLVSCRHPESPEHVVTLFYGLSAEAAAKVARLLFFYGWQSYLVFQDGKVLTRGDFAAENERVNIRFDSSAAPTAS